MREEKAKQKKNKYMNKNDMRQFSANKGLNKQECEASL